MTTRQLLLLASCVYVAFLVATVYFTRATSRRVLGAVAVVVAVVVVGFGVEVRRRHRHWRPPILPVPSRWSVYYDNAL
jgi:hypothetical protein